MLSEQSAATVHATLPAVGAAIGDIADRFYERLFAAHPELLRDLFNRGNQASGTQRRALAGSIAAFATHLVERPDERPDVLLNRIAHKHASLGIAPEQYATVREHLFAAIAEVLGDAVTPEVEAAWDEVYWLMANALIAIERRLYAQHGDGRGGWRVWEVVERVEETADVATFRLRPADGGRCRTSGRASTCPYASSCRTAPTRYASTASPAPPAPPYGRSASSGCTVRPRAPTARCPTTSTRVCTSAARSSSRRRTAIWCSTTRTRRCCSPPCGIGVTPVIAMLEQLALTGHRAPVTVVHADRSPADHALRADHEAYAAKLADAAVHFWYEQNAEGAGRPGRADLSSVAVASGTRAYLCGPLPFMRAVRGQLIDKGVAPADIHYEVFGPDLWLAQG